MESFLAGSALPFISPVFFRNRIRRPHLSDIFRKKKRQNLPKHCLKYQSWFLHLLFKVSFTRKNVTQEFSLPQKVHLNQRRKEVKMTYCEYRKQKHPCLHLLMYSMQERMTCSLVLCYSPNWGCAGDRVVMVVNVHCVTVLGTHFQNGGKFVPQNSPTMQFDNHLAGPAGNLKVANTQLANSPWHWWKEWRVLISVLVQFFF